MKSYFEFYHTEKAEKLLSENNFYSGLNNILDKEFNSVWIDYTGLEAGFGFFAPNVASEYLTEFKVFSQDSMYLYTTSFPKMKHKESIARLTTAYQMFEEYTKEAPDSLNLKKCDVFLKGLSLKVLHEDTEAHFVNSRVYLYHYPLLEQLEEEPDMRPIASPLKFKLYTRNDIWKD